MAGSRTHQPETPHDVSPEVTDTAAGTGFDFVSAAVTMRSGHSDYRAVTAMKLRNKPRPLLPMDQLFRAFADRTRIRILFLLLEGERCVGDITTILQQPQPKISRHLLLLQRSGLVQSRKDGLWRHYSLSPVGDHLHRRLIECVGTCFAEVPELQADRRRAKTVGASGGCCEP
ncbi:ArsR/SmtB family transcription factor [Caulifigura coniformis]|uniref:ArsR/SmtB family transcription factor n=1 Tax=Caulifigura coniformis TaxID=2527983 RepID=UPI0036F1A970